MTCMANASVCRMPICVSIAARSSGSSSSDVSTPLNPSTPVSFSRWNTTTTRPTASYRGFMRYDAVTTIATTTSAKAAIVHLRSRMIRHRPAANISSDADATWWGEWFGRLRTNLGAARVPWTSKFSGSMSEADTAGRESCLSRLINSKYLLIAFRLETERQRLSQQVFSQDTRFSVGSGGGLTIRACHPPHAGLMRHRNVRQAAPVKHRICDPRPIVFRSFDHPVVPPTHKLHLASRSPPVIHLPWKSEPGFSLRPQIVEIGQERFVSISRPRFDQVVRVNNGASSLSFARLLALESLTNQHALNSSRYACRAAYRQR